MSVTAVVASRPRYGGARWTLCARARGGAPCVTVLSQRDWGDAPSHAGGAVSGGGCLAAALRRGATDVARADAGRCFCLATLVSLQR